MTKDELKELHTTLCEKARDIMAKKNEDYTAGSSDPFANFRGSAVYGVPPAIGLMIRFGDKLKRAEAFINAGSFAVAEEGIMDLGADMINYSILLTGMLIEHEQLMAYRARNLVQNTIAEVKEIARKVPKSKSVKPVNKKKRKGTSLEIEEEKNDSEIW